MVKNTNKKQAKVKLEVIGPISNDIINYSLGERYFGCCGNLLPFAKGLFYGECTNLNIITFDVIYKVLKRGRELYNGIPVKIVDRKIKIDNNAEQQLRFAIRKHKFENVVAYDYEDGLISRVLDEIITWTSGRVFIATRHPEKYIHHDVTIICNNFEFIADVVITNENYVKTFSLHQNNYKEKLYHHFGLGDVFAYFYALGKLGGEGMDWVQKTVSEAIHSIPIRWS